MNQQPMTPGARGARQMSQRTSARRGTFGGGLEELGGDSCGDEGIEFGGEIGACGGGRGVEDVEDGFGSDVAIFGVGGVVVKDVVDLGVLLEGVGRGGTGAGNSDVGELGEFLRELDAPPGSGLAWFGDDASEEFAVDEVGESTEAEAEGCDGGEDVEEVEFGDAVAADAVVVFETTGDEEGGEDDADHAAVGGHATLVEAEGAPERKGGVEGAERVEVVVVEEEVSEAATEDDAEDEIHHGVHDAVGLEEGEAGLAHADEDEVGEDEGGGVGEAVPAQAEVARDPEDEGGEVVEVGGEGGHGGVERRRGEARIEGGYVGLMLKKRFVLWLSCSWRAW
jgi:hypothetical protein